MAKFTETQRESARVQAFAGYQKELLTSYLFGATDAEREEMTQAFDDDTNKGAFLIIRGIDSKVNDKGQLTTTDKDGKTEVWEGAYVFQSLTWKTDKDGNVTDTKDFFRAPFTVTTWVQAERVVSYWIDFAERKYQSVLDTICERRKKVQRSCENLENSAAALLEFVGSLPKSFVDKFADTYKEGMRFGFVFSEEITEAFKTDEDK